LTFCVSVEKKSLYHYVKSPSSDTLILLSKMFSKNYSTIAKTIWTNECIRKKKL